MTIRTKIVATIGPASADPAVLSGLIEAGMTVARLNFSHGTLTEHAELARRVRAAAAAVRKPVAILQDLSGPRLRLGAVAPHTVVEPGAAFTFDSRPVTGDGSRAQLSYVRRVATAIVPGDRIVVSDGSLVFRVTAAGQARIDTVVEIGGPLGSRKGANVPGASLALPTLTDADKLAAAAGVEMGVDLVALSFVAGARDLVRLRRFLADHGAATPIVAKIERQAAVDAADEIIAVADGLMVARGDLALEVGTAQVPLIQKRLIRMSNAAGIPVITATQMLESMLRNPTPTRAETSDVANAILDGTDAVMLSGETAIGGYPESAVREMATIAAATEPALAYERLGARAAGAGRRPLTEAIAQAAVSIARRLQVKVIVAATTSGATAQAVAACRPEMTLVGATQAPEVARRLAVVWGVRPAVVGSYSSTDEMVAVVGEALVRDGHIGHGEPFVLVSGQPVGTAGSTNMVQVRRVGDWLGSP